MGETTAIGWTERTWNPWHGCIKVSDGCKFCYMYRDKARYGQDPTKVVRSKTTFRDPLKWTDPAMVFTCSWSDFFIVEADEWREDAWDIIRATPHLTYQILTKRPERIAEHLPADWDKQDRWKHVWLGVSVESQKEANRRIPYLNDIPASIRFLSIEPMLGAVDLLKLYRSSKEPWASSMALSCTLAGGSYRHHGVDWVIVGGESGVDSRPLDIAALRSVVEQCKYAPASVPIFVKQDSGNRPGLQGRIPDELWLKEFPKTQPTATVFGATTLNVG